MSLQLWSVHLHQPSFFPLPPHPCNLPNLKFQLNTQFPTQDIGSKKKFSLSDLTQIPDPHESTPPHATTHPPEIAHICIVVSVARAQVVIPHHQTHYQMSGRFSLHLLKSSEKYLWLSLTSFPCLLCLLIFLSILLLSQFQITC